MWDSRGKSDPGDDAAFVHSKEEGEDAFTEIQEATEWPHTDSFVTLPLMLKQPYISLKNHQL